MSKGKAELLPPYLDVKRNGSKAGTLLRNLRALLPPGDTWLVSTLAGDSELALAFLTVFCSTATSTIWI